MKPTTEELERMVVEVSLGIPREESLVWRDDPDMNRTWDTLVDEIAALTDAGMTVDVAPEIPNVITVPEGWREANP